MTPQPLPPIDHVTYAGSNLATLVATFTAVGLEPHYGGTHANGVTHMSVLGFADGSYIELISTLRGGAASPWWHDPIHRDAGPCAWAVRSTDIATDSARLRNIVPVHGPDAYARHRPDGTRIAWRLSLPGDHPMGARLPFLVQDETPRSLRVQPSPSLKDKPYTGIEKVIVAVLDIQHALDEFNGCYNLPEPVSGRFENSELVDFPGTPIALLHSPPAGSRLAARMATYGDLPVAFLIGATDEKALPDSALPAAPWPGDESVYFFAAPGPRGIGFCILG